MKAGKPPPWLRRTGDLGGTTNIGLGHGLAEVLSDDPVNRGEVVLSTSRSSEFLRRSRPFGQTRIETVRRILVRGERGIPESHSRNHLPIVRCANEEVNKSTLPWRYMI